MVQTPGFDVNYVHQRATSQVDGILWVYATRGIRSFHPTRYRELQIAALDFMLEHLSDDGSGDNVYYLGGILESAFIIKIIDERLRDLDEDDLGPENLNMSKGSRRRGSRAALRAGK